jgi:hypothetical protein
MGWMYQAPFYPENEPTAPRGRRVLWETESERRPQGVLPANDGGTAGPITLQGIEP